MNEPKFAVGDLVDVRTEDGNFDAVYVFSKRYLPVGTIIEQGGIDTRVGFAAWSYGLSIGTAAFEQALYPHQKPYGDFTEMMTDLKSGKTVEMPA